MALIMIFTAYCAFQVYSSRMKEVPVKTIETLLTIPKVIYQTSSLPFDRLCNRTKMVAISSFKRLNPTYEYRYFDDASALNLLIDGFGNQSGPVFAFRGLNPGAFKADLFRYCVIYLFGGIYVDIDMVALVPFDDYVRFNYSFFITAKEDIPFGLHNALLIARARHPILKLAIDRIVDNVKNKRIPPVPLRLHRHRDLGFTGPFVLNQAFNSFLNKSDDFQPRSNLDEHRIQILYHCGSRKAIALHSDCSGQVLTTKYHGYEHDANYRQSHYNRYVTESRVYNNN